jgi:hypothetical protein
VSDWLLSPCGWRQGRLKEVLTVEAALLLEYMYLTFTSTGGGGCVCCVGFWGEGGQGGRVMVGGQGSIAAGHICL